MAGRSCHMACHVRSTSKTMKNSRIFRKRTKPGNPLLGVKIVVTNFKGAVDDIELGKLYLEVHVAKVFDVSFLHRRAQRCLK